MNDNTPAAPLEAEQTREIRVAALCINSMGEPEFYWTRVNVTQEDYDNGVHYDAARDAAENEGYEVKRVFDENDEAAKQLAALAGFFCSTTGEAHPPALVEAKPTKVIVRISDADVTDVYTDGNVEMLVVNFDVESKILPEQDELDEYAESYGQVIVQEVEPIRNDQWFDALKATLPPAKSDG